MPGDVSGRIFPRLEFDDVIVYFPPGDQKDVASSSSVASRLLFHLHAKTFPTSQK